MRKALFPLIASLALCGAATAALIATNARAAQSNGQNSDQSNHKPLMIAMTTTNGVTRNENAAPPAEDGERANMRYRMEPGARPQRGQFCKDLYARKVGELAFLEAKLSLSPNQEPLFARWKQASLDIAKTHESECTAREKPQARNQRPTIVDRLAMEEDRLKKRLTDIQTERPALAALYGSLTPEQKEELQHGQMHHMGHMQMGMMERPHMGFMGPGMGPSMDRRPVEPPQPPPAPAQ
jgi:Spy/CpxP family protein refolding chaperone